MKICFFCDLHLSQNTDALQYTALRWAVDDIGKTKPDCIVYAGDVTADGNADVYRWFISRMEKTGIPFFYIPGNSDLRDEAYASQLKRESSPVKNTVGGISVFAVNDCEQTVDAETFSVLEDAADDSIVFMHHPPSALYSPARERMEAWRKRHENTKVFYAHVHRFSQNGAEVSLPALDPDKSIGESPSILYYDTETKKFSQSCWDAPVPNDLYEHFGVTCYSRFARDIEIAIKYRLKNLELRPGCAEADPEELSALIEQWRAVGGENLSIHLPDVEYRDGKVYGSVEKFIPIAARLRVDRFTQHTPKISVREVRENPEALLKVCAYLADALNSMERDVVIGVENLHMTAAESPDDSRRFGYIPEECIEFMQSLSAVCRHKVGINFDIGHARNNAPFSQTYQISTWFAMVGKYIVGYHFHQVTSTDTGFKNHTAITEVYGHLISFASFFRAWSDGIINKAPVILEMDGEGAYETTLQTFQPYRCES